MIGALMWVVTIASLVGTIANIKKRHWCFWVWLVTNTIWFAYDLSIRAYAQSGLFAVYMALAVYGINEWRKK